MQALRELGLTDLNGTPPTVQVARQTWFRVRRDVARGVAKQRELPPPVLFPSRLPATLRPPIVASPAAQTSPFGLPAPQNPSQPTPGNRKSIPEEAMARIRQVLAERSR